MKIAKLLFFVALMISVPFASLLAQGGRIDLSKGIVVLSPKPVLVEGVECYLALKDASRFRSVADYENVLLKMGYRPATRTEARAFYQEEFDKKGRDRPSMSGGTGSRAFVIIVKLPVPLTSK